MSNQIITKSLPRLLELRKSSVNVNNENFKRRLMEHLCFDHKLISYPLPNVARNVASVGGERSYVLLGSLAKLERALMRWTINELVSKHKFTPVVVPNIVYDKIIEKCGFPTKSSRSQIYKLAGDIESSIFEDGQTQETENKVQPCLAGTSEFALASIHIGDTVPSTELPKRFCALSRCYRAETSSTSSEWGVYRVHYFNKVEMFALTMPSESIKMHDDFLNIQKDLFKQLDLHFQVLEMPENDLGLSAKKKYDIEAWMEGRQRYGEISSTSNCEDYQSSRLNIKYSKLVEKDDQLQIESKFVHTVNGTACSSIRTLIALVEQHQTMDGKINVPAPLVPYMDGVTYIPTTIDKRLLRDVELVHVQL